MLLGNVAACLYALELDKNCSVFDLAILLTAVSIQNSAPVQRLPNSPPSPSSSRFGLPNWAWRWSIRSGP